MKYAALLLLLVAGAFAADPFDLKNRLEIAPVKPTFKIQPAREYFASIFTNAPPLATPTNTAFIEVDPALVLYSFHDDSETLLVVVRPEPRSAISFTVSAPPDDPRCILRLMDTNMPAHTRWGNPGTPNAHLGLAIKISKEKMRAFVNSRDVSVVFGVQPCWPGPMNLRATWQLPVAINYLGLRVRSSGLIIASWERSPAVDTNSVAR
jgi:hypothetical protein